jgi:hypothetical protein
MGMFSVTVPIGDLQVVPSSNPLTSVQLIVNDGWATFNGVAESAEEFEESLRDSIIGLPDCFVAVESW